MLVTDEPLQDHCVLFKAFLQTEEEWLMDSLQSKCWALGFAFPLPFFLLSYKLAMTFQTDNVATSILFFFAPFACMNKRQRLTKVRMGY